MPAGAPPTAGGTTARESPQEAARRIREQAERRARRFAAPAPIGAGTPDVPADPVEAERSTARVLAGLPPGWATVRSPRLGGAVAALGPGGVVVAATDPDVATTAGGLVADVLGVAPVLVHLVPDGAHVPEPPRPRLLVLTEGEAVRALAGRPRVLAAGETAALGLRLDARLRVPASTRERRPLSRVAVVVLVVLGLLVAAALAVVGSQVGPRLGGAAGDLRRHSVGPCPRPWTASTTCSAGTRSWGSRSA